MRAFLGVVSISTNMSGYLVNIFYITGLNNTNTRRSIVYLVHAEQRLVLWYEGVSGRGQDLDKHVRVSS